LPFWIPEVLIENFNLKSQNFNLKSLAFIDFALCFSWVLGCSVEDFVSLGMEKEYR